jgi:hypothetical protein
MAKAPDPKRQRNMILGAGKRASARILVSQDRQMVRRFTMSQHVTNPPTPCAETKRRRAHLEYPPLPGEARENNRGPIQRCLFGGD